MIYSSELKSLIIQHLQSSGLLQRIAHCSEEEVLETLNEVLTGKAAEDSALYSYVRFAAEGSMTLTVTSTSGLACSVEAAANTLVAELKTLIAAELRVPPERQQLFYNGQILEDEKHLFDYWVSPWNPGISLTHASPAGVYALSIHAAIPNPSPAGVYALGIPAKHKISRNEAFDINRDAWYNLTPMLTEREGFAVVCTEGKIYIAGGNDGTGILASAEVLDLTTSAWTELPAMSSTRYLPAAVAVNGQICVLAGADSDRDALDSCEAFDISVGAWSQLPPLPTRRKDFGVAAVDGKIYAAGGKCDTDILCSFEAFQVDTRAWSKLPPLPAKRDPLSVAVAGEVLYACGGLTGFDCCHASVHVFDIAGSTWSQLPHMITRRIDCGMVELAGRIYAFGGYDGVRCLASMEMFDPDKQSWQLLPSMSVKRRGLATAVREGRIYALGGVDVYAGVTKPLATAEVFDPETGWKSLPSLTTEGIAIPLAVDGCHLVTS